MLETEQGADSGAETPKQTETTTQGETSQTSTERPKRAATTRRRTTKRTTAKSAADSDSADGPDGAGSAEQNTRTENATGADTEPSGAAVAFQPPGLLFQQPDLSSVQSPTDEVADAEPVPKSTRRRRTRSTGSEQPAAGPDSQPETAGEPGSTSDRASDSGSDSGSDSASDNASDDTSDGASDDDDSSGSRRRRRRRGGRRRGKAEGEGDPDQDTADQTGADQDTSDGAETSRSGRKKKSGTDESTADEAGSESGDDDEDEDGKSEGSRRRRRRRRRKGEPVEPSPDDPEVTVVKVREPRKASEGTVSSVEGSTRLEAKRQRRREGRDAGRRRPPILTEAEFLTRRESVERTMVIRQRGDVTQIAVLEDNVLVEHYVARQAQTSLIGNVYLGRVQNVLPSMEAAFIDIGRGRNAVLYAGEVDWAGLGVEGGQARRIESALKSGQTVPVQVTKDPVGHKGARLTSQISLAGRYLVYVPHGSMNGISRKLPDTERNRLKQLLKEIVDDQAGVVVRTAAEGASEEELDRDVSRLRAQWETIEKNGQTAKAPELLYAESDLLIKVVRDLFTEDFARLVVAGDDAWDMVEGYVGHVAPHLTDRLERWNSPEDCFAAFRVDEQIMKALDRKVWLPSGGSLIIERTEAMTVIDVNTGKFTGSGGNLEETVTKNNLEAAEEIVRQLRLRDIGGIVVVDFIDMVLESNRELVLRRLVECLGRDRTKHQVAEVTSLGLVQMTRKRIGTGLLEAFSEPCEHCKGRGHIVHVEPMAPAENENGNGNGNGTSGSNGSGSGSGSTDSSSDEGGSGRRSRRRRRGGGSKANANSASEPSEPSEPAEADADEPSKQPAAEATPEPAAEATAEPAEAPTEGAAGDSSAEAPSQAREAEPVSVSSADSQD